MDIFDVLSKKIGYRKFSNREKILFVILILLFLEFLFYNFLIKSESQKVSEVEFNEGIGSEDISYEYNGLETFSKENIDKIALENNLNRDNFTKEGQTDLETLSISGKINNSEINKISTLINYYGYSNIELNRSDENTFTYSLKAEKPSTAIYYSDLKRAYFNESAGSEKKIEEESKKEETNSDKVLATKTEEIKNTKAKEIKNTKTKNIVKDSLTEKVKEEDNLNTYNTIKGYEEKLSYFNGNIDKSKDENISPSLFEKIDNDKFMSYKFIVDSNVKTSFYSESGITSFFVKANDIYDLVKLGVEKHCDGISLSLLFPYDSCKEIGIINISGDKIPFTGKVYQGEWFRINLFAEDISYIYFLPQNNEDLFFFVKEVEYNEEI